MHPENSTAVTVDGDPSAAAPLPAASGSPRTWLWVGIGMVLVLIVAGYLLRDSLRSNEAGAGAAPASTGSVAAQNRFGPQVVDEARILGLPLEVGHPVYWAGALKQGSYELTIAGDGSVVIRYLAGESAAPDVRAMTVATYPKDDAYGTAVAGAQENGSQSKQTAQGLVVGKTDNAYNGYLAVEGLPFLIEAYSPQEGQAWSKLTRDKIVAISN